MTKEKKSKKQSHVVISPSTTNPPFYIPFSHPINYFYALSFLRRQESKTVYIKSLYKSFQLELISSI